MQVMKYSNIARRLVNRATIVASQSSYNHSVRSVAVVTKFSYPVRNFGSDHHNHSRDEVRHDYSLQSYDNNNNDEHSFFLFFFFHVNNNNHHHHYLLSC